MRIIDNYVETCRMCNTTFEYTEQEKFSLPGYSCMQVVVCPKCGQQIIMIADDFKSVENRIFVEDLNEKTE